MTQVDIPGGCWLPSPHAHNAPAPSLASRTINASGEKFGYIVRAPVSGTLNRFEFACTAVDYPNNGLKISFQNVNPATGVPDGVVDQFRVVPALQVGGTGWNNWVQSGLMTSDGTDAGARRTVSRGDLVACVVEFNNFVAGDNVKGLYLDVNPDAALMDPPYGWGSGPGKIADLPLLALQYDEDDIPTQYPSIQGCEPIHQLSNPGQQASSPGGNQWGMGVELPFSARLSEVYLRMDLDGDAELLTYDPSGSVVDSVPLDKDIRSGTTQRHHVLTPSEDTVIGPNERWRFLIKPTSGTIVLPYWSMQSVPNMAAQAAIHGGAGSPAGLYEAASGQLHTFMSVYAPAQDIFQDYDAHDSTHVQVQKPWGGIKLASLDLA